MEAKLFAIVRALAAPKALNEVLCDELLQLLETQLSLKGKVHQFLSKYESEGQSIAEFVASLRAEIGDCEFVSACKCRVTMVTLNEKDFRIPFQVTPLPKDIKINT